MSTEVHGAPGAPESDSGEGRRGSRIERLRAALSLPTLRRATGLLDGRHKSVFVGRGQDFDDMSFYRPGDDISYFNAHFLNRLPTIHTQIDK